MVEMRGGDWIGFEGKGHPNAKIQIRCYCGRRTKAKTSLDLGTEFYCRRHGLIAFAITKL